MNDFKYEKKMKKVNKYNPRARLIIINNNSLVYTLWK